MDDALSVKKNEDGSFTVGVHVADVSYFGMLTHYIYLGIELILLVKPNTALDREARKRGTSVHLVQRPVPMLPPQMSEELCSLQPGVERLAFSAFFRVDKEGRVVEKSFARTIIRCVSAEETRAVVESQLTFQVVWEIILRRCAGRNLHGASLRRQGLWQC